MVIFVICSNLGVCVHRINSLLSICYSLIRRDSFRGNKLRGVSGYREVKVSFVGPLPELFTTCKEESSTSEIGSGAGVGG